MRNMVRVSALDTYIDWGGNLRELKPWKTTFSKLKPSPLSRLSHMKTICVMLKYQIIFDISVSHVYGITIHLPYYGQRNVI